MTEKEKESVDSTQSFLNDPLYVAPNEATNVQISLTLFDGNNFITWSRHIKLALGAKNKLGFIDGTLKTPEKKSKDLARWTRGDHIVRCWIFRSMKEEIANDFFLVESAKQLWDEIVERFSQSNTPLLFQLKCELSNLEQGDLGVAEYYSKMKKKWDEIQELEALPQCACGAMGSCSCGIYDKLVQREEKGKIIDFLMKLSPDLKDIRGQILAMDPLPNLNKVFQLVHQSEGEKRITGSMKGQVEMSAFMAQRGRRFQNDAPSDYRKDKQEKLKLRCDYCGKKGSCSGWLF